MASRRAVLQGTAGLLLVGLAGCEEESDGGDDEPRGFVQVHEDKDVEFDAELTVSEGPDSYVQFDLQDPGSFDRLYVQIDGEPVEDGELTSAGDFVVVQHEEFSKNGTVHPIEIVAVSEDFHGVVLEYHERFGE